MSVRPWILPEELRQLAECGDAGVVEEVLSAFRSDTAERLAALRQANAAGNRDELRKQAHTLKGSAGQVGASGLAALCRTLEASAGTASADESAALISELDCEFEKVGALMAAEVW